MKHVMKIAKLISFKSYLVTSLILPVMLLLPQQSKGQVRAGVGYLKMLHGSREVGTAGTMTAALDHSYSFYANPAATGFLREWQWSATYTNWISDVYNASFLYGRKIAMPWSRLTRFSIGANYLGIPEFTNSSQSGTLVSGNNLLVTGSVGQPLSFLTSNLALGANLKYFSSDLADFKADAFIVDLGLVLRTPRFGFEALSFGLFEYMIFSAGISLTNLGNPMMFVSEETPLPRTLRGGIAMNLGKHHGLQFSLGADYREIRDEDSYFTIGSEISWRQLFALRMGYSWEDNLLGHFTFGGSIRFDDQIINNTIFGRNNALRLDLATNEYNSVVDSPYHGTVTHQPLGPESFSMFEPVYGQRIDSDSVTLKWEFTRDPDLYDDVNYWLLVDRNSSKLAQVVEISRQNKDTLFQFLDNTSLLKNQPIIQRNFMMNELRSGNYFWTVLAYDKDNHIRFAEMEHHPIAKFRVTAPDPRVIAINFDYSPWITTDDYQGVLNFTVVNFGDRVAENFSLSIYDSTTQQTGNKSIYEQIIPAIPARDSFNIELEWHTLQHGLHDIKTEIIKADKKDKVVHSYTESFYSIPKGIFATQDTVYIQHHYHIIYDLPYVGKIFFDNDSDVVRKEYIRDWVIEPPLKVFAKRLKENPSIRISLQGTIDPNSAETNISLANERALTVRSILYSHGVNLDQMVILDGIKLPSRRRPRNPEDLRWVLEERRRVDITTDESSEEILFNPLQTTYIEKTDSAIIFHSNISGVVPFEKGEIYLTSGNQNESLNIAEKFVGASLPQKINLFLDETEIDDWLKKSTDYYLTVTDSLDRIFKVRTKKTYLDSKLTGLERRYYVLAKFESASPFYNFYWTNLINTVPFLLEDPRTRMCFHGHGCATGPERINNPLSKKRSEFFQNKFLQDVQQRYPDLYEEIEQRTDPPKGAGESQPLDFRTANGESVVLGDNNTPLGRQLNRRVMIFFYTSKEAQVDCEKKAVKSGAPRKAWHL
jgi:outer membrane protein OmpA-like peptidoglycan-associated protein